MTHTFTHTCTHTRTHSAFVKSLINLDYRLGVGLWDRSATPIAPVPPPPSWTPAVIRL